MDKKIAFSVLLGSAVMLTGCGKKMNQFAADYFTTNPNPSKSWVRTYPPL